MDCGILFSDGDGTERLYYRFYRTLHVLVCMFTFLVALDRIDHVVVIWNFIIWSENSTRWCWICNISNNRSGSTLLLVKTKFRCSAKSVLEFQGMGNGFHLTLMTFRQLTFPPLSPENDDADKDGDDADDDDGNDDDD